MSKANIRLLITVTLLSCLGSVTDAQITWRRTYGGQGSNESRCVRQTSDGGFAILGSTGSFGAGGGDIYFLRLNELGELLWSKTYGDAGVQSGISCRELSDGYILAGTTSTGNFGGYDMLLIRTDLQGEIVWQRSYGTGDWDICNDMDALPDGFVFGGITYGLGAGLGDAWVFRTDLDGDTIWTKSLGGAFRDEALGVDATGDGGVLVSGVIGVTASNEDGFLSKLSSTGALEWTTEIGGDSADYLSSAVETPNGDVACSGSTRSYGAHWQILHVKISALGDSLWGYHFGNEDDFFGREIQLRQNGGYAIAGSASAYTAGGKDMFLVHTASDGSYILGKNYGGPEDEEAFAVAATSDGGFITAGVTVTYGPGIESIYVVKGDTAGETFPDDVVEITDPLGVGTEYSYPSFSVFPNPIDAGGVLNISCAPANETLELTLFDVSGRTIRRITLTGRLHTADLLALAPGSYRLVLSGNDGVLRTAPLIVQ